MRAVRLALPAFLLIAVLHSASAQEDSAPPRPGEVNPNPLAGLSLESLSATLAVPLFTPSRQAPVVEAPEVEDAPAPQPAPEVAPEQPPPSLQLVGIVLSDAKQTALLRDLGTNEVHRLASGEDYDGWSLKIVDARSVEFSSGGRVESLRMFESFPQPTSDEMPVVPAPRRVEGPRRSNVPETDEEEGAPPPPRATNGAVFNKPRRNNSSTDEDTNSGRVQRQAP